MIRWFLNRQLDAFQRHWGYDVGYGRQILDADPAALIALAMAGSLGGYRKSVPPGPYFAAKLVATTAEDCGPCSQLVLDMAADAGCAPDVLRAIIDRDYQAMPAEVALAVRFAEASLAHAPEADEMREDIVRLWGERGLVSLAYALAIGRLYPTVKYALGHGRACMRLAVAGETGQSLARAT
jgi:hypothetical protein